MSENIVRKNIDDSMTLIYKLSESKAHHKLVTLDDCDEGLLLIYTNKTAHACNSFTSSNKPLPFKILFVYLAINAPYSNWMCSVCEYIYMVAIDNRVVLIHVSVIFFESC